MKQPLLYFKFALQFAIENKTLKHIKQYKRWYKDMKSGETTMSLSLPWMTYDAIDFLNQITSTENKVFEWGSGSHNPSPRSHAPAPVLIPFLKNS